MMVSRRIAWQLSGPGWALLSLLALILFLPIPFGNIPPACAIACLSLGLAERDGVAVAVGYVLSAASVAILAAVSSALYAAVVAFVTTLFGA